MEQGNLDPHRTETIRSAGSYLLRALAISAWATLALYTAVYWGLIMTESVSVYLTLSRGGARQADSPASEIEAQPALTTTIVTILIQCLVLAGIAFAMTRIHGTRPLRRLPTPPESRPRRWLYAAGIFTAAALITAMAFNGPGAPSPAGELDADPGYLAETRTLLAGALEEPIFAALPVLILAALPTRWITSAVTLTVAIAVSAAGRAVIHLYQGPWPAAAALVWGAAAVYIYYRYRVLSALIAVHTLWNLGVLAQYGGSGADRLVLLGLAVLAGVAIAALSWAGLRPPAPVWAQHDPVPASTAGYSKSTFNRQRAP